MLQVYGSPAPRSRSACSGWRRWFRRSRRLLGGASLTQSTGASSCWSRARAWPWCRRARRAGVRRAAAGLAAVCACRGAVRARAVDRPAPDVPARPAAARPAAAGLALNRVSFQIMLTAGPALAGLIAAAPHLGLRACYLADAVTFAAALYGVARLPAMRPRRPARPGRARSPRGSASSGAARCWPGRSWPTWQRHGLRAAGRPVPGHQRGAVRRRPAHARPVHRGHRGRRPGQRRFSGPVGHVARQGRAMLFAVAVWGAAFAGFAVASSLWLTLGLLAVAGAADMFTVVFRGTIVRRSTPDRLRGRVIAAD